MLEPSAKCRVGLPFQAKICLTKNNGSIHTAAVPPPALTSFSTMRSACAKWDSRAGPGLNEGLAESEGATPETAPAACCSCSC